MRPDSMTAEELIRDTQNDLSANQRELALAAHLAKALDEAEKVEVLETENEQLRDRIAALEAQDD